MRKKNQVQKGDEGYIQYGYSWYECVVLEVQKRWWSDPLIIVKVKSRHLITDSKGYRDFVKKTVSLEKK